MKLRFLVEFAVVAVVAVLVFVLVKSNPSVSPDSKEVVAVCSVAPQNNVRTDFLSSLKSSYRNGVVPSGHDEAYDDDDEEEDEYENGDDAENENEKGGFYEYIPLAESGKLGELIPDGWEVWSQAF